MEKKESGEETNFSIRTDSDKLTSEKYRQTLVKNENNQE